jgi:hypothetical protein
MRLPAPARPEDVHRQRARAPRETERRVADRRQHALSPDVPFEERRGRLAPRGVERRTLHPAPPYRRHHAPKSGFETLTTSPSSCT